MAFRREVRLKILLTGKDGQVGWELQRSLAIFGDVLATGRADLDLADAAAIRDLARRVRPQLIVNAAAYTAVERAEVEERAAFAINGTAPGILAEEAKGVGALLVHYSTDYVFSGEKAEPYAEIDEVGPINAYGRSKLAGERAVAAVGGRHLVLRTCWVYTARGRNFLLSMKRLLTTREEVSVVDDQRGSPTPARLIAEATAQMARAALREGQSGIFNVACAGETTWYGFARAIAERLKVDHVAKLSPIPSSAYVTAARRPSYSVLSGKRLARDFGIELPCWERGLEWTMADAD